MDEIKELVHIINQQKTQSINIIGDEQFREDTKLVKFYKNIASGTYQSDDDAAADLFGTNSNDSNYKKLRSELKNRLLNTSFFLDVKRAQYSNYETAYYNCSKEWAAIKILLGKGARLAAINLVHKVLKQANKYEFNDLLLDLLRILQRHYATFEKDKKKFDKYNEMLSRQMDTVNAEVLSESLFSQLAIDFSFSNATKKETYKKATDFLEQLQPYYKRVDSSRFRFFYHILEVTKALTVNDYRQTIEICDRALAFFESKPFFPLNRIASFLTHKLVSHIQLKEFNKGREILQQIFELRNEGSINWFHALGHWILLCLRSGDYQEAFQHLREAQQHPRFEFMPDNIREDFLIYEAFVHYLIEIGKIQVTEADMPGKKFRLSRFLNDMTNYSKDKQGMNIPIIIIQLLFQVTRERYDEAIDRIEAVKKYVTRYLLEDHTYRSNYFIKMMLTIPANDFRRELVEEKALKYMEKLREMPLENADQSFEIEIIPYEELWEMVLDQLK